MIFLTLMPLAVLRFTMRMPGVIRYSFAAVRDGATCFYYAADMPASRCLRHAYLMAYRFHAERHSHVTASPVRRHVADYADTRVAADIAAAALTPLLFATLHATPADRSRCMKIVNAALRYICRATLRYSAIATLPPPCCCRYKALYDKTMLARC